MPYSNLDLTQSITGYAMNSIAMHAALLADASHSLSTLSNGVAIVSALGAGLVVVMGATWYLSATIQRSTDQLALNNRAVNKLSGDVIALRRELGVRDNACAQHRQKYNKALNTCHEAIKDQGVLINTIRKQLPVAS